MILGKDHLDEGRSAGRGLALFDLGQVSFVEFGMGGDKDAADAPLETEVAFRGLAQNIAQSLSDDADCFHNLRRSGKFLSGMWSSLQRVYNGMWRETRQSQAFVCSFLAAFVETGGPAVGQSRETGVGGGTGMQGVGVRPSLAFVLAESHGHLLAGAIAGWVGK